MGLDTGALKSVQAEAFKRTCFRLIRRRYASQPLSMMGSLLEGGRYNVEGAFGALYTATDPDTCRAEVSKGILGDQPLRKDAFVLWQYKVRLGRSVRLDKEPTRTLLGLSEADITGKGDRQWAKKLGAPFYFRKMEGIISLSAHRQNGVCVAIFLDNLQDRSEVIAQKRLRSWP